MVQKNPAIRNVSSNNWICSIKLIIMDFHFLNNMFLKFRTMLLYHELKQNFTSNRFRATVFKRQENRPRALKKSLNSVFVNKIVS